MHYTESQRRMYEKIHNDLGERISALLRDKDVNEIMVNPDGKLWMDNSAKGLVYLYDMNQSQIFSIIHGIAGAHHFVVNQHNPSLEAELPFYGSMRGERFTAQVPPIVSSPSFTIRKKSESIFTLDDYTRTGRLSENQSLVLKKWVAERKNILVCGGPGTGKTTVTNALIIEMVKQEANQRIILLEDLPELQCSAINKVAMLTCDTVNMTKLLRAAMRMRPDRILIGEVRGAEALDMLKAWNTGCPGGICTVHANGGEEAVQRIIDLAMEAGLTVPPIKLVAHTIDAIVSVSRHENKKGFIKEMLSVGGYKNGQYEFKKMA